MNCNDMVHLFCFRRSHVVLQRSLPYKHEYVFLVRMSPIQRKLYRRYIDSLEEQNTNSYTQSANNPLKAFSVGCKVSTLFCFVYIIQNK